MLEVFPVSPYLLRLSLLTWPLGSHFPVVTELDELVLQEKWRTEDEERARKRQLEMERKERELAEASKARSIRAGEIQHLLSLLSREAEVSRVERERQVRHKEEEAQLLVEKAALSKQREEDALRKAEVMPASFDC